MRIFLDTADTSLIKKHFATGLIDGVTTNPTLIMKSGRNPEDVYQELIDIGVPDISMEVVGGFQEMVSEGKRLAKKFGKQCTVKVPCTSEGLFVCHELKKSVVKVNVTLIFDVAQAILASKAGAAYVSPFVGRVDDNSFDGLELIRDIDEVFSKCNSCETKILSASIRDVKSVSKSFANGADIVTMPPTVFEKMYRHILTDRGLELFDQDWSEVKHLIT